MHGRGRRLACDRRDGRRRCRRHRLPLGALRSGLAVLRAARSQRRRSRPRADRGRERCRRAARRARAAELGRAADRVRRRARRHGAAGRRALRASERRARRRRRHRHERQDDDDDAAGRDARRRAAAVRPARHRRAPHRRPARARRADDARGARPAALAALDDRGRRRGLRDGGLVDRDRAAPARRHASSRRSASRTSRRTTSTSTATSRSYFAAKASLFDGRFPRAVNADDAYGARLGAELRFGVESTTADVRCEAFELRPDRTELFVRTPHGALSLEPRLRGRFNVDNVLCAVALALLLEVPLGAIERAVAATGAPPGRFEPVEAGQGFGVIVDYAHTPGGIEAVLASARPLASGRMLCVFGAGGDRDHAKRPLMGAAAEAGADRVYVTSDNSRSEATERDRRRQILGGLERPAEARVEHDRRRAIGCALGRCRAGRPRADPRQGPRAGPGHRRRRRAVRRPHRGAGAARRRRVIPLAAGELAGTRLLSGDPATAHRERRHRFARGRAGRALLRARGRARRRARLPRRRARPRRGRRALPHGPLAARSRASACSRPTSR